jgi:hypothetical protein
VESGPPDDRSLGSPASVISGELGADVTSARYEIRVEGTLPPEVLLDFERLTASREPVGTVVHGQLPDEAALYGLLARLQTFGVQVREVRRLQDDAEASDGN